MRSRLKWIVAATWGALIVSLCLMSFSLWRSVQLPPLLNRDFHADAPNQKWAGDIIYAWTREGLHPSTAWRFHALTWVGCT